MGRQISTRPKGPLKFLAARINLRIKQPRLILLKFKDEKSRDSVFLDLDYGIFEGIYKYVILGEKQHPYRTKINRLRAYSHKDVLDKRTKTNQTRYGYSNYFQQVEKVKKHCLDKLGVDNPLKNPKILDKVKKTNIERYGIDNPSKNPEIIQRIKDTFENQFGKGITNAMQVSRYSKKNIETKIKNGKIITIKGKLVSEISKERKISFGHAYKTLKNFGEEGLLSGTKGRTAIENWVQYSLKKYNINFLTHVKFNNYNIYPDINIEKNKLIIECDGEFWHCDRIHQGKILEKQSERLNRRKLFEKEGYKSLFFRGTEIIYYQPTIESIILNNLDLLPFKKIHHSYIKLLQKPEARTFLRKNHIICYKDFWDINIGLLDNNELIAVAQCSVNEKRKEITIRNFCIKNEFKNSNSLQLLCEHIKEIYLDFKIKYILNCRFEDREELKKIGFLFEREYSTYEWIGSKNTLYPKNMFKKEHLGYKNNFNKIWDCGKEVWYLV